MKKVIVVVLWYCRCYEIIPVMNTFLEVRRAAEQALITRDRMRADVTAEFYVRVKPTVEAICCTDTWFKNHESKRIKRAG